MEHQNVEHQSVEHRVLDKSHKPLPRGVVVGVAAVCLAMTVPVLAQVVGGRTLYLWDGSGATERGVRVGSWGNGDFEVEKNAEGRGQSVLEVRTRNFYEGVRFQFAQPVLLDSYRQTGLLRMRLRSEKLSKQNASPEASASPGASPNPFGAPGYNPYAPGYNPGNTGASYPPGGFPPGGYPGMPGFGGPGGPGATPAATPPVVSTIQVVLRLERGALFGQFPFDEKTPKPDARGWQTFVVPLSQMRATPNASGGLRTVILSGDREGSFDLGQIALAPNSGSNSVSIRRASDPVGTQQTTIEVPPGELRLVADVESGATDVVVEWNFDADKTGALPAPPSDVLPKAAPSPGAPGFPFGGPPGSPYGGPQPGGSPYGGPPYGGPSYGGPPFGVPGAPGDASSTALGDRLDARGYIAQARFPNEEQDYRVEATVKDRATSREIGKASVIVKVRSPE